MHTVCDLPDDVIRSRDFQDGQLCLRINSDEQHVFENSVFDPYRIYLWTDSDGSIRFSFISVLVIRTMTVRKVLHAR